MGEITEREELKTLDMWSVWVLPGETRVLVGIRMTATSLIKRCHPLPCAVPWV